MKDWMSHLLWYGNASVLKSVQSDLKLISPFHFFFLLFLAREKITSVFLFLGGLEKKKKTPFYCPKLHTEFQRVTSSQI